MNGHVCDGPAHSFVIADDRTTVVWPQCGSYSISNEALTLFTGGTLDQPDRLRWLAQAAKYSDSAELPLITLETVVY